MFNKEKRIAVNVSEELHQELKIKAAQEKTTLKTLISKFIAEGLKKG